MTDPRAEYERRLAHWRARIAKLDRVNLHISHGRLLLGVARRDPPVAGVRAASISPAWPVGVWLAFGVLAVVHARQLQRLRACARRRARLPARPRSAERRVGGHRPRRDDVSRGPSLRPRSRPVRPGIALRASQHDAHRDRRSDARRLAPAGRPRSPEVRARHAAVDELRPMLDFREDVAVLASESPVGRTGLLAAWAASAPAGFRPALRIMLAAFALVTVALAAATYFEIVGSEVAVHLGDRRSLRCVDLAPEVPSRPARDRHARARSRPAGRRCSRASSQSASRRRAWRRFSSGS